MTSHRVITQIIYQTIEGDRTLCSADSYELKRYGLTTGLTNYAAAYATGFLLARRLLKQLKMQDEYKGVEKRHWRLLFLFKRRKRLKALQGYFGSRFGEHNYWKQSFRSNERCI